MSFTAARAAPGMALDQATCTGGMRYENPSLPEATWLAGMANGTTPADDLLAGLAGIEVARLGMSAGAPLQCRIHRAVGRIVTASKEDFRIAPPADEIPSIDRLPPAFIAARCPTRAHRT